MNRCRGLLTTSSLLLSLAASSAAAQGATPLDRYVAAPDPAFQFTPVAQLPGPGVTITLVRMVSQQWRTPQEVTPNLWTHWLIVVVPDTRVTDSANLIVSGGRQSESPPSEDDIAEIVPIALATGAVTVALQDVPGQPLLFAGESTPVTEDDLVARSWALAMRTGDPTWAAYLPMTKATVRAMDTVQALAPGLGVRVTDFVVIGFSKRGATSWLTAAVDSRVRAVVPGVFNTLDLATESDRSFQSYGNYPPAITPYEDANILQQIRSPEGSFLLSIVDPISYADRLTMPQLLLQAGGDEFFLPDASRRFIDALPPGTATQRIVPNESHGFERDFQGAVGDVISWIQSTVAGVAVPRITDSAANGILTVRSDQTPAVAIAWVATNPNGRDFRRQTVGDIWVPQPLTADADGAFRVPLNAPPTGYSATMVEFSYAGVAGIPQRYTSSVYIVPDDLPFVLENPIDRPRLAAQWQRRVRRARRNPNGSAAQTLEAMLPILVQGEYVRDLDGLQRALRFRWSGSQSARRQCTAARLNIQAERLGWYSPIRLGSRSVPLWQRYQTAESLATRGLGFAAAVTCAQLNLQR